MKEKVKTKLLQTKWGKAIDLTDYSSAQNSSKKLAFLDYERNHRDFEEGKEYTCEIFYSRWYFGRVDKIDRKATIKDAKDHIKIIKNTLEECDEEFERIKNDSTYGLDEKISDRKTQAYFRIIRE